MFISLFYYLSFIRRNISLPTRYSYLSGFPDDNADIFVASLLISYGSFSFLIWSSIVMISFYIFSKILFLKRKWLSDARVSSVIKKEHGFLIYFLQRVLTCLKSIYDRWLCTIFGSCLLFGILIIKKCVVFSVTSFVTLEYDHVIKIRDMFSFLHFLNKSITTQLRFLSLFKTETIPSNKTNTLPFFLGFYSSIFWQRCCIWFEYSIKTSESLSALFKLLNVSRLKTDILVSTDL